ncbi:uncharacterized protein IUM83_05965 [Phytophthora cinnamomi]|uniref:uncharacterized protein n=1 Tax=Phytophthora cinnamomi TaxID=4785 RepID=UPI003559FD72|nr:hypothetical protein IUM83_05965 [Phytophthora cinnamomi]
MTALLVKSPWKQQHEPMPAALADVMPQIRVDDARVQEARAWTLKLRHGESASPSPSQSLAAKSPLVVEASSKKHRFSLRRLFKHEHHEQQQQQAGKKAVFVPPVPIPTDFLTRERHGGVTVSGKRVPFTRDAHKRRKKTVKPLPRISEDRAQAPASSSLEAYRRRAYYPAKKDKAKKGRAASS